MKNKPILSICIATYNRGQEVYDKIRKILSCNKPAIEVVVSDNASTDNTVDLLNSIKNDNFVFIENKENKGAVYNYMRALDGANAKYAMFMTDKDSLDLVNIECILDYLEKKLFAVGYFALDYKKGKDFSAKEYTTEKKCLSAFAYLSKHPTGYIYNNDSLKKLHILDTYTNIDDVGYFPFEFIAAELSLNSIGVMFDVCFCETCPIPKDRNTFSATYSSENNNIFFSPKARLLQFERYVTHLSKLNIAHNTKKYIYKKLLKHSFSMAIQQLKKIMQDANKCHYYKVEQEIIDDKRVRELTKYFFKFIKQSKILSKSYGFLQILIFKMKILIKQRYK